ncbi:MAG: MMPL family transporter [Myxococcota bacterium]
MISQWLSQITRIATRRPGAVIGVSCLLSLLGLPALFVPWDMSFAPLMDRSEPEIARYFTVSERYGLGAWLPLLVEGPEDRIDRAVTQLELALDDLDVVESVHVAPPREWLLAHTPWLVDDKTFELWINYAAEPADRARLGQLRSSLEDFAEQRAQPVHVGKRLVLVTMANESFELALDAGDFPQIRETTRTVLTDFSARGLFAGMPAILTQDQEATLERMRWLIPISLLLVVGLFRLIDRRMWILCSVALPMLQSVAVTLGAIALLAGRLTLMESIFGVVIFGLGIDFAIHLALRLREERRGGLDFEPALLQAMTGTGRGVVAAAVTSGGSFLILALAPDPVFHRLGLAGGLGLLLCLGFLLFVLPAAWTLIERRWPEQPADTAPLPLQGLQPLTRAVARRPGITALVSLLLLAASVVGMKRLHFETDLERIFSRRIEATRAAEQIHDLYGLDPGVWLVAESNRMKARQVAEAFEDDSRFASVESAALLIPTDPDLRAEALARVSPGLAQHIRQQERANLGRTDPAAVQAREDLLPLEALLRAQSLGPPTLDRLPSALERRLIGPGGEWLVFAFPAEPALDARVAARERRAAREIAPEATSINVIYEVLLGGAREWMAPVLAAVIAFVVVFLYLDLRNLRALALVFLPLAVGGMLTLGGLGFLGFRFNLITLVGIPLLVGLGVDSGIHVVRRMLEQPTRPPVEVVGAVAPAIAMTTLTTCASLTTLLWTDHPGIESFAIFVAVGLGLCLLASVTVLPALAILSSQLGGSEGKSE